ncbi:MAG: CbiX/SirB N-terminal domain-containing protein, partial [Planctomycetaceae bacterium]
ATDVRMLPYFLSMGRHVVEHLEEYRQQFAARYPNVAFTLCPPLGLHPKVVEVVLERLEAK